MNQQLSILSRYRSLAVDELEMAWNTDHDALLEIAGRLQSLCPHLGEWTDCPCDHSGVTHCADRLMDCIGDLLLFSVDHYHHEDRLLHQIMGQVMFPEDVRSRLHWEHHRLTEALSRFGEHLDESNPLPAIRELQDTIQRWMQDHLLTHAHALSQTMAASLSDLPAFPEADNAAVDTPEESTS